MKISATYTSKQNYVNIECYVKTKYGNRSTTSVASFRKPYDLEKEYKKWNEDLKKGFEHKEIKLVKYVLSKVTIENQVRVPGHIYNLVIRFYRLKPSELLLGSLYSLLSILMREDNIENILNSSEIKVWKKIDSITRINHKLKKYSDYTPKSKNPFVFEYPDVLVEVIAFLLKDADLDADSLLFDFRKEALVFVELYRAMQLHEDKFNQKGDFDIYTLLVNSKRREEFIIHLNNSLSTNYSQLLGDSIFNHPLTKKIISYHSSVIKDLFTVMEIH